MATNKNRKLAQKYIKALHIHDGDVLLIRKWSGFSDVDREALITSLKNRLSKIDGVTLLFVDKMSDVRTLDATQMKNNGWIRSE